MNHRKRVESVGKVSEPGRVVSPGGVHEKPVACVGGTRHRGGVTLDQALVRNVGTWEPVASMAREKSKEQPSQDESTEARHRGGATRSSGEAGETRRSEGVASSSEDCSTTA